MILLFSHVEKANIHRRTTNRSDYMRRCSLLILSFGRETFPDLITCEWPWAWPSKGIMKFLLVLATLVCTDLPFFAGKTSANQVSLYSYIHIYIYSLNSSFHLLSLYRHVLAAKNLYRLTLPFLPCKSSAVQIPISVISSWKYISLFYAITVQRPLLKKKKWTSCLLSQ